MTSQWTSILLFMSDSSVSKELVLHRNVKESGANFPVILLWGNWEFKENIFQSLSSGSISDFSLEVRDSKHWRQGSELEVKELWRLQTPSSQIYICLQWECRLEVLIPIIEKSEVEDTWKRLINLYQSWANSDNLLFGESVTIYIIPYHRLCSVQFSYSVMSNSLRPHESQHTRPPCPSPAPGVHSNSRPSSQWCHPAISSSVIPFSSCPQSFPASGSFQMSQFFARSPKYWTFSFSISPSNEYSGLISFRIDWFDLLAGQGTLKSHLQNHSSKASILRHSAFFTVQLSHPYLTTGKTIALTRQNFVGKVMSLLFNMLSRLVITFIPRSKHLLISWLHRLCGVIKNMECLPQLKWCTKDLDLISTDDFHFRFLPENVLHSVIQKHCWKKGDCRCFWFMDTPKIYIWTRPSENCQLRSNWYKCFFWSLRPLAHIEGCYHKASASWELEKEEDGDRRLKWWPLANCSF